MERLKPLNDFIFKKLFGEEGSKEPLISLLNAILDFRDTKRLIDLNIIGNTEIPGDMIGDKTSRLDVLAEAYDGTKINIEVQLTNQKNMDKRTLFYWGKLFLESIKKGDNYRRLNKVITINILDFSFLEIDDFHSKFHLWEDKKRDFMLTDILEIQFIEMPKFRNINNKDISQNALHRWLTFFEKDLSEEVLSMLMEDDGIKKAEEKLEYLSSDPAMIALYKAREDSLHERANMISGAIEEGMEKGIAQGLEQGTKETKIEIARLALHKGLDVSVISEITGITEDIILQLKNELTSE